MRDHFNEIWLIYVSYSVLHLACKHKAILSVFQHQAGDLVIRRYLVSSGPSLILICSHLGVLSALSGVVCLQLIWWAHFVSDPPLIRPRLNVWSSHEECWCSDQPSCVQRRSLTLSAVEGLGCWNILFECDNEKCWDIRCLLAQSWEFSI